MTTSPEPIGDAFQRAVDHWRRVRPDASSSRQEPSGPPPLTVAISREAASGGGLIAGELAAMLTWPVYDKQLVEQIATDSGLSKEIVEAVDEHRSSFIVETLEAFTGASTIGGAGYAHRLAQTLAAIGAHGECVIVGRGATAILPRQSTVSIRIVATLNDRVARHCQIQGVNQRKAKTDLQRIDRERADFVKRYFHQDIDDPHNYDLVLNASRLTQAACMELCQCALRQKQASS